MKINKRALKFYSLSVLLGLPIIVMSNRLGVPPFFMIFVGFGAGMVSAPLAERIIRNLEYRKENKNRSKDEG